VTSGLTNHVVKGVRSTYNSATNRYLDFCFRRRITPWPVDPMVLNGWIHHLMCTISTSSLRTYLAAVKYSQFNEGYTWTLNGDESIRRTIRNVKRLFPCPTKGVKMPITLGILRRCLPMLKGWPNNMSHDDNMFATASIVAVTCFLRGGEFLDQINADRPILRIGNIRIMMIGDYATLIVTVPQTKTRWWEVSVDIPAFGATAGPFDPATRWKCYTSQSALLRKKTPATSKLPAFHFADGRPLCRNYMVKRTLAMLAEAGISTVDSLGKACNVVMASWRAGAVRSAWDAGIERAAIMELGRWRSEAWQHYLLLSSLDLRRAGNVMWSHAVCPDRHAVVPAGLGPELC
jgi:hypothetical protein